MAPCSRRGFTLVELLVALAISGVLLAFGYQILLTVQRNVRAADELAEARQNARVAIDELARALSSAGSGVDLERGQMRLLVAHPHQIVFNSDVRPELVAMTPGSSRVPGAQARDPWALVPGTYGSAAAETYRYTLDRTGDGNVDAADRSSGEHFTLYREANGGANEELALAVANARVGRPLFRYEGDFDGNGSVEVLDRVDRSTSARVAAGAPLDAVIRAVHVTVLTESSRPDPTWPFNDGYRRVELGSRILLRNLP